MQKSIQVGRFFVFGLFLSVTAHAENLVDISATSKFEGRGAGVMTEVITSDSGDNRYYFKFQGGTLGRGKPTAQIRAYATSTQSDGKLIAYGYSGSMTPLARVHSVEVGRRFQDFSVGDHRAGIGDCLQVLASLGMYMPRDPVLNPDFKSGIKLGAHGILSAAVNNRVTVFGDGEAGFLIADGASRLKGGSYWNVEGGFRAKLGQSSFVRFSAVSTGHDIDTEAHMVHEPLSASATGMKLGAGVAF